MVYEMRNWISKTFGLVVIGFILFIGIKGCTGRAVAFKENRAFEHMREDGQVDRVIILAPKNELILIKKAGDIFEMALFKIRGVSATHYFGPVYNVGPSPFGIRLYSDASEVWDAQLELLEKRGTISQSTFGNVGEKHQVPIAVYDNKLQMGTLQFHNIWMDEEDIHLVRSEFEAL